ncbi:MAG: TetR/AcrR family transcriptional regulator [Bacteroidales bacterium]|nr:TetR/AcrR family transcriptional regulator [Bacteroidales bacterium]
MKKQEIRDDIINSAQVVFSKYGFDRTTIELIAKEAGRGKSTLYYYFKNKEDIFVAVIDKEWNFLQRETIKIINSDSDTQTIFRKFSLKRFQLADQVKNYTEALKTEFFKQNKEIQKHIKKYMELEIFGVKQILLKGIVNNELGISEDEVDAIALSITITMKGLETPFIIENNQNTLENKLDILLKLLFHGLLKK